MVTLTEKRGSGAFLAAEANGTISRENVTVLANAAEILVGTVMGKITASGKLTPWDPAAVDGSENAYGIIYHRIPISATDTESVAVVRHAEVVLTEIIFNSGASGPEIAAAKAALLAKDIKML